jgi:H/ACA ribonucleoprotein complex subunit 1
VGEVVEEEGFNDRTMVRPRPFSVCYSMLPMSKELMASAAELGSFVHAVEDEMLCSSVIPDKVPHFNAPIYLQNKSQIGKIDEILGPINEVYFSVKMEPGMVAASFKKGDKVYVSDQKLLPIERFLPKPRVIGGKGAHDLTIHIHVSF